jgi:hypothetical protein
MSALSRVELLVQELDIPPSARDRANKRYQDLADFFASGQAHSAKNSPHIYPQGSFRLGTVVRPLDGDEYDLDVGCRLRQGITKQNSSQRDLKSLVGQDLRAYRSQRGIQHPLEEKHRCWRLSYQDELSFHMDVVPSIPEDDLVRGALFERIIFSGVDVQLAQRLAGHAGAITDNRLANYARIDAGWKISNSEGFALWFETRMQLARVLLERNAALASTTIDQLPSYRWRSPLQAAIRILKRHRDVMYRRKADAKPISIIITTLAAQVYEGETDVETALAGILDRMGGAVRPSQPRVPNPVNPIEDFADKWHEPAYAHLQLEANFWAWLAQARASFNNLRVATNIPLFEQALTPFAVRLGNEQLAKAATGAASPRIPAAVDEPATRPWYSN